MVWTLRPFDELWSGDRQPAKQAAYTGYQQQVTDETWLIAEGGAGCAAYLGFQQAISDVLTHNLESKAADQIQHVHLPVATGTSYVGYVLALTALQKTSVRSSSARQCDSIEIAGELVLKGAKQGIASYIQQQLAAHDIRWGNHSLSDEFHGGGYAKTPPDLVQFVEAMNQHPLSQAQGLRIEPVYSGKLLHAVAERIRRDELPHEPRLVVHTGGLQGFRSF